MWYDLPSADCGNGGFMEELRESEADVCVNHLKTILNEYLHLTLGGKSSFLITVSGLHGYLDPSNLIETMS